MATRSGILKVPTIRTGCPYRVGKDRDPVPCKVPDPVLREVRSSRFELSEKSIDGNILLPSDGETWDMHVGQRVTVPSK